MESPKNKPKEEQPNQPSEGNECPICQNPITDRTVIDPCLHEFCRNCIQTWSTSHRTCPVCRQEFNALMANIRSDTDYESIPLQRISGFSTVDERFQMIARREELLRRALIAERDRATIRLYVERLRQELDNPETPADERQHIQSAIEAGQNMIQSYDHLAELRRAVHQRYADDLEHRLSMMGVNTFGFLPRRRRRRRRRLMPPTPTPSEVTNSPKIIESPTSTNRSPGKSS